MDAEIERVLQSPAEVRASRSDTSVKLFYEFYARTLVGSKMVMCRGKVLFKMMHLW